jgi:hypothetical protein
LALVYNPVYVLDAEGARRKAWADFAAGGMAVYESSVPDETYLDFWIEARSGKSALLTTMRNSAVGGEEAAIQRSSPEVLDLAELAEHMFNRECLAAKRRAVLGHWPTTFAELLDLLRYDEGELAGDVSAFHAWLRGLSTRALLPGSA